MDVNQCVCVEWGGFQAFCREMLRYTLVYAIPILAKSKNPLYLTKGTVPAFIQKPFPTLKIANSVFSLYHKLPIYRPLVYL